MLLDVIVIDDCNGFLFATPSEGENQRSDSKAFEFFLRDGNNDRDSTVKSSSPFALYCFFFTFLMSIFERRW